MAICVAVVVAGLILTAGTESPVAAVGQAVGLVLVVGVGLGIGKLVNAVRRRQSHCSG